MFLTVIELEDGIKKITLQGRMDIDGTQKIDMKFTAVTASESANVIVDLSGVEFISSIGIFSYLDVLYLKAFKKISV